jgi:DNA/RNA endonuclease YhcR with UshA esterase domain
LLNYEPKEYFVVVIQKSIFHRFTSNPEFFYFGKNVLVTGKVRERDGKPEITLNDPSQITILEESPGMERQSDVVSWKDASNYCGKHVKVFGRVVSTFNSGRACFLNLR